MPILPAVGCSKLNPHSKQLLSLLLLFALSTIFLLDQLQVHRLTSLDDLHQLFRVTRLPQVDQRCRVHNITHFQCLPNLFIIGASKTGTTSLVHFLRQLPHVHFVRRHLSTNIDKHSEIHLFDRPNFERSWKSVDLAVEWASCPLVTNKNDIVVHYTPHYLYAPSVPFEMRKFYPSMETAKFVILLRDPLERALSSYWFKNSHLLHGEGDSGSIEDFIKTSEEERIRRREFEMCMLDLFFHQNSSHNETTVDSSTDLYLQLSLEFISAFYCGKVPCITSNASMIHKHESYDSCLVNQQDRNYSYDNYLKSLQSCFGKEFRKPSLGLRHIDKSIYFDQLIRWILNFHPSQMLLIQSNMLLTEPASAVETLLTFASTNIHDSSEQRQWESLSSIDFSHKQLQKPNRFSKDNQLTTDKEIHLRTFFDPYQSALNSLICPND